MDRKAIGRFFSGERLEPYVKHHSGDFENDEVELYNLAQDIGERNNLASEESGKKNEMLNALREWWEETNAPIPTRLNPEYKD